MKDDNRFTIRDIAGGLFVVFLIVVISFASMEIFYLLWDKAKSFLHWANNPVLLIVLITIFVIFIGIFFSFVKIAENGFNIRKVLNDIIKHFKS